VPYRIQKQEDAKTLKNFASLTPANGLDEKDSIPSVEWECLKENSVCSKQSGFKDLKIEHETLLNFS